MQVCSFRQYINGVTSITVPRRFGIYLSLPRKSHLLSIVALVWIGVLGTRSMIYMQNGIIPRLTPPLLFIPQWLSAV